MEGSGQIHAPAALFPGKNCRTLQIRGFVFPRDAVGIRVK
jgi:hypothetical protein